MNKPHAIARHVSTAGKKATTAIAEAQQAVGMVVAASLTNADAQASNHLKKEADCYLQSAQQVLTEALASLTRARQTLNNN